MTCHRCIHCVKIIGEVVDEVLKKELGKALEKKLLLRKEAGKMRMSILEKRGLIEQQSEIAKQLAFLSTAQKLGRTIHPKNDYFLNALQEIAVLGCGADNQRRDLTEELKEKGLIHFEPDWCLSSTSSKTTKYYLRRATGRGAFRKSQHSHMRMSDILYNGHPSYTRTYIELHLELLC